MFSLRVFLSSFHSRSERDYRLLKSALWVSNEPQAKKHNIVTSSIAIIMAPSLGKLLLLITCFLLLHRKSMCTNTANSSQKDVDYPVEDDIEEDNRRLDVLEWTEKAATSTSTESAVATSSRQPTTSSTTVRPAVEEPKRSLVNPSAPGTITNMSDIVKLVRFVFLRGHIVLDASHRVLMRNESRIERLMDYLHDIQLRRGKKRVLPMEDRNLACEDIPQSKLHLRELCSAATFDCLSASEMMDLLPKTIAFHQAIARICPLLLFRQSRPICIADVKKLLDAHLNQKIKLVEPSIERVWGFGVLFVTISIIVSMGGLMLLPFLKKSSRTTILTFFEGLAVGGLAGSAILHLFPQAFDIVDDKYRAYFWNTSFIFGGIYIFYFIEMCLKIFKAYHRRNRRKRVPSSGFIYREGDIYLEAIPSGGMRSRELASGEHHPQSSSPSPASSKNDFLTNCKGGDVYQIKYATSSSESSGEEKEEQTKERPFRRHKHSKGGGASTKNVTKEALISSTREQLAQCLSTVNVISPTLRSSPKPSTSTPATTTTRPTAERMVNSVALRRQDHESANTITIDTVAWMIVLGDALLNFIDGLSIGAAFDRNILAGMSISVAVMLEEVCHRLGTFAVLIRAGMSMKQAFVYIFLSACSCYPGLALGIFLGDEAEDASPYIFALAGGFFLYMALVDVMKAMQRTMDNASRKNIRTLLTIWALQNLGIVLAAISLALLAFYEKEMDFERREIAEIRGNSFV